MNVRYVFKRSKQGARRKTKDIALSLTDKRPTPYVQSLVCDGARTIRLHQMLETDKPGKRPHRGKMKRNSSVKRIVPGDEADVATVAYESDLTLRTQRPYTRRQGKPRFWGIVVRKTWDPATGPTKTRKYTLWFQKRANPDRVVQRVE